MCKKNDFFHQMKDRTIQELDEEFFEKVSGGQNSRNSSSPENSIVDFNKISDVVINPDLFIDPKNNPYGEGWVNITWELRF